MFDKSADKSISDIVASVVPVSLSCDELSDETESSTFVEKVSFCINKHKFIFISVSRQDNFSLHLPDHRTLSQPIAKHLEEFLPIEGEVGCILL